MKQSNNLFSRAGHLSLFNLSKLSVKIQSVNKDV